MTLKVKFLAYLFSEITMISVEDDDLRAVRFIGLRKIAVSVRRNRFQRKSGRYVKAQIFGYTPNGLGQGLRTIGRDMVVIADQRGCDRRGGERGEKLDQAGLVFAPLVVVRSCDRLEPVDGPPCQLCPQAAMIRVCQTRTSRSQILEIWIVMDVIDGNGTIQYARDQRAADIGLSLRESIIANGLRRIGGELIAGRLGCDVDHPADSIAPVQCALGPPQNFNLTYIDEVRKLGIRSGNVYAVDLSGDVRI